MSRIRSAAGVAILAGTVAIFVLPSLLSRRPATVASLIQGTEDAFAESGFEPRENQIGGGAIRWLRPKALFRFEGLGPGYVDLDLVVEGHRSEVTLTANGARIGSLMKGQRAFRSRISLLGESLVFGIETEGFAAPGRTLGTQFVSLRAEPVRSATTGPESVPMRLWLAIGASILVASLTQLLSGLSASNALLPPLLLLLMVLPAGLWRSGWLIECTSGVAAASVVSALVSMGARGAAVSRGLLQVAVLAAITIHGVLPPSPLMIQGDAQLHGNKLAEVAQGNRFPTSRTDHLYPFDFPYGFSFHGLLSPFVSSGVSNVRLVREGAAFFSALSALFLGLALARKSASFAAASLTLWAFAPVNIRTMAFGNLSNVFAQAVFVLFLAGVVLMRPTRLRSLVLTFLVALSATAHLSSFIVFLTLLLITFLVATDRHGPAFKSLLAGVLVAASYYLCFLPMILAQVPRLLWERGGSSGVFDPWKVPSQIILGLGWPLAALLVLSALVASVRVILPLSLSLALAGVLLAGVALVSPIEVRYLLALLPLLAILGAAMWDREAEPSFSRPNLSALVDLPGLRLLGSPYLGMPLAWGLLTAAIVKGSLVLFEFIPLAPS